MLLWLQFFLISAGFSARLFIPASTAGIGLNLLVYLFIWLAFLIRLIRPISGQKTYPFTVYALKILLVLWIAFVFLSFFHAPYKFGAFPYLVSWITDIVLFYLIWQSCTEYPGMRKSFIWLFLSNAVVITLVALHQHFWGLGGMLSDIQQDPQLLNSIPEQLRQEFLGRAAAAEPFATLTYQNSLAAFLVLSIPILVVSMFCYCADKASGAVLKTIISKVTFGLLIFLTVLTLVLTGSKGGIVAFFVGMAILIAFWLGTKLSKSLVRALLIAGIVCLTIIVIISAIVILSPETPQWIKGISNSMEIRFEYWRATAKVIENNFWSGVGLNQFGSAYLQYKSASAGETIKAHNDYLQIASEMGIPAFFIFLLIWLLILRSYSRKFINTNNSDNSCNSCSNSWNSCLIFGAAFAFILSEVFYLPLIPTDVPFLPSIILIAVWLLIFKLLSSYFDGNSQLIKIGLFAGIFGFLIHSAVDFNFYVSGLSMSIWFIGAILFSFLPVSDNGNITRIYRIIRLFLISLVVIIIVALCFIITRLMQYETELELGKSLLHSNSEAENRKAPEHLGHARYLNVFAVDPNLELARYFHRTECISYPYESDCIRYMNRAIVLSPNSAMLYYQASLLYDSHADMLERNTDIIGRSEIPKLRQKAQEYLSKFKELYPTFTLDK